MRAFVLFTYVASVFGQYFGGAGQSLAQLPSLSVTAEQQPSLTQFQQLPDGGLQQIGQQPAMAQFRQPYPAMQSVTPQSMPNWGMQPSSMAASLSPGLVQSGLPTSASQVEALGSILPQPIAPPVQDQGAGLFLQGTASVAVQDFLKLANSMETFKGRAQTLEQQLAKAEQQLFSANMRSAKAEKDVAAMTDNSKKITSLAQVSVDEARKSLDKEQTLVDKMKKELDDTVKVDADLKAQLTEARSEAAAWKAKAANIQKSEEEMIRTFQAELRQRDTAAAQASEAAARASEAAVEVAGLRRSAGPRRSEKSQWSAAPEFLESSASPYLQQQGTYFPQRSAERVPAVSYAQTSQGVPSDEFVEPPLRSQPSSDNFGFLSRRN
jgi:hypothetical protein